MKIIRLLEADGWRLKRVTGSHRHFTHRRRLEWLLSRVDFPAGRGFAAGRGLAAGQDLALEIFLPPPWVTAPMAGASTSHRPMVATMEVM